MSARLRDPSPYEVLLDAFRAIGAAGPVTCDEIRVALLIAAGEFEAESYDSGPFHRLLDRLGSEGIAP